MTVEMERIQQINPVRIEWCCADFGISPKELALTLGIAERSIERVMAGEDGLSFNQLRKIADYFGRGVLFFLEEGEIDETQVHTTQFRTIANQKSEITPILRKLVERVERQREIYVSLVEDLDESEQITFNPPDLEGLQAPKAAEVVREWLGYDRINSFEGYRNALQLRGILVFKSNGYSGKWQIPKDDPILGFTLYNEVYPVIFVKKQLSETRQTFTLAHELGHLLLHKNSSIDDENDMYSYQGMEREANAFAGYLLFPDQALDLINDAERPEDVSQYDVWLNQNSKAYGVSCEVILRRLLDAGRLPRSDYNAYRERLRGLVIEEEGRGSRQYRHREPINMFGEKYVKTVLDALYAKQITLTKATNYLDSIKISDLHKLEGYYAGL